MLHFTTEEQTTIQRRLLEFVRNLCFGVDCEYKIDFYINEHVIVTVDCGKKEAVVNYFGTVIDIAEPENLNPIPSDTSFEEYQLLHLITETGLYDLREKFLKLVESRKEIHNVIMHDDADYECSLTLAIYDEIIEELGYTDYTAFDKEGKAHKISVNCSEKRGQVSVSDWVKAAAMRYTLSYDVGSGVYHYFVNGNEFDADRIQSSPACIDEFKRAVSVLRNNAGGAKNE